MLKLILFYFLNTVGTIISTAKKKRFENAYILFNVAAMWESDISEVRLILRLNCLLEPTSLRSCSIGRPH